MEFNLPAFSAPCSDSLESTRDLVHKDAQFYTRINWFVGMNGRSFGYRQTL